MFVSRLKTNLFCSIALLYAMVICAQTPTSLSKSQTMQFAIDHYAINVVNLERSVSFYQDVFGLQEIKNGTELIHIRWFRLGNSQELHVIQVDSLDKKIPKGVHLALAVSDFDRFRESVENKNIAYSDWPGTPKAISTRPDAIRQLYFQDPDGYWIEVNDAKQF